MTPDQIRAIRNLWGLSQAQLADIMGVHLNTVGVWERTGPGEGAYILPRMLLTEMRDAWENTPTKDREALRLALITAVHQGRGLDALYLILQANR